MRLAMQMQALAARGVDLQQRMERGQPLNADECKTLADAGLELERESQPAQHQAAVPPGEAAAEGQPK